MISGYERKICDDIGRLTSYGQDLVRVLTKIETDLKGIKKALEDMNDESEA